jgi:hypothetical protein
MLKQIKSVILMVVLCTVDLSLAANSAVYEWRNVSIGGGGFVDGLIFHPCAQGIMYTRTDVGGAYRWNPASSSWVSLTDWIGRTNDNNLGVLAIGLDNNDTGKVFLLCGLYTSWWATSYAHVLGSSNGGKTFDVQTNLHFKVAGNGNGRQHGERLAVDPNDGKIIYITSQSWDSSGNYGNTLITFCGALWKSADAGKSFDSVKTGPTGNGIFVAFDSSSGTKGAATKDIYVSFDSSNSGKPAVWRSRDAGETWSVLSGQPTGSIPTHATVAGNYIFFSFNSTLDLSASSKASVWRFNKTSETWTEISPVKNPGYGYGNVGAYNKYPERLVLCSMNNWNGSEEIWLSTDTGNTWTKKLTTGTLDYSYAPWISPIAIHWCPIIQYDPFDSTSAYWAIGHGVFRTTNLLSSNPVWSFPDSGLEETAVCQMVSPPSGAPLVSALGDMDGFRHVSLDKAPQNRHLPSIGTTLGIDVAWMDPAVFVKVHDNPITNGGKTYGSISLDSAKTWTGFATQPPVRVASAENGWSGGGGNLSICISADASSILWVPVGPSVPYISKDKGATWTAAMGTDFDSVSITYARPVSDKVNGKKLYLANPSKGTVSYSTDGGSNFTIGSTVFDKMDSWEADKVSIAAVPGYEGDVWVTWGHDWSNPRGLYHSVNGGGSFTNISNVKDAWLVGLGKAAPGKTYPAIFLYGIVSSDTGIFISTDSTATWERINDDAHQYGTVGCLIGDPNVFGRVYLHGGGRGIIYRELTAIPISYTTARTASAKSFMCRAGSIVISYKGIINLMDFQGRIIRKSKSNKGCQILNISGLPHGVFIAQCGIETMHIVNVH